MTSYPLRIDHTHLAVKSILSQSAIPERVILYLAAADFPDRVLPRSLTRLVSDRFEFRFFDRDLKSYLKLVPALTEFPELAIVTCDDDCFYPQGWFSELRRAADATPGVIVCWQARRIGLSEDEVFAHYKDWRRDFSADPSFWLLALGVGGVWYPPRALHRDTTKHDIFMRLAPRADDIWFKAMSWLSRVPCRRVGSRAARVRKIRYLEDRPLYQANVKGGGNDEQLAKLLDEYAISPGMIAELESSLKSGS